MTTIIDAHQHNWQIDRFEYRWLRPGMPLHRDCLPDEAKAAMDAAGVEACVLVGADDSLAETAWLLELAGQHAHIRGVVGWMDFTTPGAAASLAANAEHPTFKGVRMNWLEPRADWEVAALFLGMLSRPALSCDLRLNPPVLPQIRQVIGRNPGVTFVLDHFAGAKITAVRPDLWAAGMKPLAELPNVVLKISGYLTAYPPLTPDVLDAYLAAALELFGAERLMYGSDWPLCTQDGGAYGDTLALLRAAMAALSPDEQAAILGSTAARVYRLAAED